LGVIRERMELGILQGYVIRELGMQG